MAPVGTFKPRAQRIELETVVSQQFHGIRSALVKLNFPEPQCIQLNKSTVVWCLLQRALLFKGKRDRLGAFVEGTQ